VHRLRVAAIDGDGVHLTGGTVDLRRFHRRSGELLATDIIGARVERGVVHDVAFVARADGVLVVDKVAVGSGSRLRLRPSLTEIPWRNVGQLFALDANAGELARLRNLHKADAARRMGALPAARRAQLAAELDAEQLADVLEELPERQQVEIIARLDLDDAVEVLEEMEVDDAADLLREIPAARREALLHEMDDDDASQLRRLLDYREDTAGGLMTPEPVIVTPDTPVAEVVAKLRDTDLSPALAHHAFLADAPTGTPTGRFRGYATLQRLLHEPPSRPVGECMDEHVPTVLPHTPERVVADLLARYDLLSIAVVDGTGRLVGAVTVDDVLQRMLEQLTLRGESARGSER
jgi:Mg/Co/Ni transporter MgtE